MMRVDASWDIETLIKKAILRVKDRFLGYVLAYIIMYAVVFGVTFVLAFIGAFAAGAFISKSTFITGLLFSMLAVLGVIAFAYVVSLTQLAIIKVLIQKKKRSIIETFKSVKEDAWGFVWLMIAIYVFFIGLIPFGIVSVGVIILLWGFWSTFVPFVYLAHKHQGLDNLWVSYRMISQRFWGILGRTLVVLVGYILVSMILTSFENDVLNFLNIILSLLFGPFMMSYQYEMFKLLDAPKKVERPRFWIALSVVGYVLMLLLAWNSVDTIRNAGTELREFYEEQNEFNDDPFQNLEEFDIEEPGTPDSLGTPSSV